MLPRVHDKHHFTILSRDEIYLGFFGELIILSKQWALSSELEAYKNIHSVPSIVCGQSLDRIFILSLQSNRFLSQSTAPFPTRNRESEFTIPIP